ncbi:MAG: hypothetical protein RLN88_07285 [Ekhidna sp.]|uniref:hypothetical protein n=1 Tax=Ekhidna sp. TaxID=2608089 RepID=UPI0032EE951A
MRILLAILLAVVITDPKEVAKANSLKKEAEQAYLSGDYELALSKFTLLRDSMEVDDPAIKLNIAHAHYNLGDTAGAKLAYNSLTSSGNTKLKSVALQQLGVMSKDAGKLEEALQQLKSSIKADPANQEARYNYEVVKKLLEEQKQQQKNQNQQNQDQQNQDGEDENQQQKQDQKQEGEQENKDNQQGENQEKSEEEQQKEEQQNQQEEGEEQQQEKSEEQMTKEKLEEMGISEEKARQLLEAMRQSEIKYLQHQRRKPTKRPPSDKPDW